jgi:hypothetical protein
MAAITSLPTQRQHTDQPALRDFRQEVTDTNTRFGLSLWLAAHPDDPQTNQQIAYATTGSGKLHG